jgi:hypothetical protein
MSLVDVGKKNEWGVDRFDMEDAMIQVAMSQDDLKLIMDNIYDGRTRYSVDKMANAIYGLVELMEARTKKMEDIFAKLHLLDDYAPEHVKALRPLDWESWAEQRAKDLYWNNLDKDWDDLDDFPDNVRRDEGLVDDGESNDGC